MRTARFSGWRTTFQGKRWSGVCPSGICWRRALAARTGKFATLCRLDHESECPRTPRGRTETLTRVAGWGL